MIALAPVPTASTASGGGVLAIPPTTTRKPVPHPTTSTNSLSCRSKGRHVESLHT